MGYNKLSQFMSEKQYTVFRQFQPAAARDLLWLQAELVHLESEYQRVAKADQDTRNDDERQHYAYEWWHLSTSADRGHGGEQWAIALEIRSKLREYYASLLQYSQISSLNRPKESEIRTLQTWIESPHLGGGCGFLGRDLGGFLEPAVYDAKYKDDLLMLANNRGEDDGLTRFLSGPVLRLFHRFWKHYKAPAPLDAESQSHPGEQSGLHHYSDAHVHYVISILGTVSSSLTPMVSIIVLYLVTSTPAQLGLVCAFTLIFSLTLALTTRARRVEIFAATAAFASVQVVFVGTANGSNGGSSNGAGG